MGRRPGRARRGSVHVEPSHVARGPSVSRRRSARKNGQLSGEVGDRPGSRGTQHPGRPGSRLLSPARAGTLIAAASLALSLANGGQALADRTEREGARTEHHGDSYRASIDSSTWVDHDAHPIPQPKTRKISLYAYMFRQAFVEPISHLFDVPDKVLWLASPLGVTQERHSANVNAFDEVPNSTWFTNRNHVRSVPSHELREGPFGGVVPAKPWKVTSLKQGGYNVGFQIKDAEGRKWLVKLDRP